MLSEIATYTSLKTKIFKNRLVIFIFEHTTADKIYYSKNGKLQPATFQTNNVSLKVLSRSHGHEIFLNFIHFQKLTNKQQKKRKLHIL